MQWLFKDKQENNKPHHFKPNQFFSFFNIYFLLIITSLIQVSLNQNEISIKVSGTGDQLVIYNNQLCPDSIYLNGNPTNAFGDDCRMINIPDGAPEESIIRLIWTRNINSFQSLFENITNIVEVDLTKFDSASIVQMRHMFFGCSFLTSIHLSNLNTASVFDMWGMFNDCGSLISLDLSSFDTSNVELMGWMFRYCTHLTYLNIRSFQTNKVKNMHCMFDNVQSLENLDLSSFDTSNVIHMNMMFSGCHSLKGLDLSNFITSSVIDMSNMFLDNFNLKYLHLTHFDTSNVEFMGQMFRECKSLTTLDLSTFDTAKVKDMGFMFFNCHELKVLDLSNFRTPKVETVTEMFWDCHNLISLDMSNFDTSQVTNFYALFAYCRLLNDFKQPVFDTSSAVNLEGMFFDCQSLTSIDLKNLDASKSPSMNIMFYNCVSLRSIDFNNCNTENVKSMGTTFYNCQSLTTLDLSCFNTASVESFDGTFMNCISLSSLDLSSFNTVSATNFNNMFNHCESLTSIELSSFNTPELTTMSGMFDSCYKITSLDLSKFNVEKVTNMVNLFAYCRSLEKINLDNFVTSSVNDIGLMFVGCSSLTSLDLSSFITTHVHSFYAMFYENKKLEVLDISSFDTNSLADVRFMFAYCENLEYINFQKYNEYNSMHFDNILHGIRENIVVCIDESNNVAGYKYQIDLKWCPTIDCSGDYKRVQKKIIEGTTICAVDCQGFRYEYNQRCYSTCPEGADFCNPEDDLIDNQVTTNIIKTTYSEEEKNAVTTNNIITTDNMIYTTNNIDTTINIEEKNLETTNNMVSTTDIDEGNDDITTNNVVSTDNIEEPNDITTNIVSSNSNTNEINDAASSFPSVDNHEEKISNSIPEKRPSTNVYIVDKTNEYTHHPTPSFNNEEENTISQGTFLIKVFNISTISGENNEEIYQKIINDVLYSFISSERSDLIIEGKHNYIYQITTSEKERKALNSKNNTNQLSKIDLGECEQLLKDHYEISEDISLIIIKYEKISNFSYEREIQYEVYDPISKSKLDLSICSKVDITIYTPVVLSDELLQLYNQLKEQGYDLFNLNSAFYRDICVPYTSPNGTDVLLDDRIEYFFNNNETSCQSNCKFEEYSLEEQLLKCDCDVSNSEIDTKVEKKFTKKTLYQSFYDTLRFSNYKVLKCYKLAFHINSVTVNIGSIIAIIFFSFYFVFLIIYSSKGIKLFKIEIARRLFIKPNNSKENNNQINNTKPYDKNDNILSSTNIPERKDSILDIKSSSKKLRKSAFSTKAVNIPPKKHLIENEKIERKKSSVVVTRNINLYSTKYSDKTLLSSNKFNSTRKITENVDEKDIIEFNKEKEKEENKLLDNFELNNLEFDIAIKLDKRSYIKTYWSILRREHLIVFTFFARNDHNILYVKLARFIFLICTDMALNVFFFSDATMHKMYIDYGKYNFVQQIPQIVYSTVATQIIEVFLCFLSLTDKHYYEIKNLENLDFNSRYKMFQIIKCVKIKLTFFFIFTFIFFAFYWYSIACFCAVYPNTQSAFIKDSLMSFALGLLYPFVLYLFPVLFRIISLRAEKSNLSCLYTFSDLIPFF